MYDQWLYLGMGRKLYWKESELKDIDRKSREVTKMLLLKSYVDRLYKRKNQSVAVCCKEQAIRKKYVKHYSDRMSESPLCRSCWKRVNYRAVSRCEKLVRRNTNVGATMSHRSLLRPV